MKKADYNKLNTLYENINTMNNQSDAWDAAEELNDLLQTKGSLAKPTFYNLATNAYFNGKATLFSQLITRVENELGMKLELDNLRGIVKLMSYNEPPEDIDDYED